MTKLLFFFACLLSRTLSCSGQDNKIAIPNFNDRYSDYVAKLENGQTNIDYQDFRQSFLESEQYALKGRAYDSLKQLVPAAANEKQYQRVITLTKAMLSIDYTSMFAHKYLQQTYKILGDTANCNKYHNIEFGLLHSIIKNGDGKACETGWPVTQIEEEYFILYILGAQLQQQSISRGDDKLCDKLEVRTREGAVENYFFEASKIFEQEHKLIEQE